MSAPDAQTLVTWATAISTVIILVKQLLQDNRQKALIAVSQNTNDLVNGQHGKALDTIVTQAKQISSLTGTPDDKQKVIDAEKAASDHAVDNQKPRQS